jgi:hypothetical protein
MHILKIIYDKSDHIIIISKEKDKHIDNEGLYKYDKINLIIIYSENILPNLPNFNKLILKAENELDSTIDEFESIKSKIYGTSREIKKLPALPQIEKKTDTLAYMRTKIVNAVRKAPKVIRNIGSTLFALKTPSPAKTPPRKNTPYSLKQQNDALPSLEATIGILNLLDSSKEQLIVRDEPKTVVISGINNDTDNPDFIDINGKYEPDGTIINERPVYKNNSISHIIMVWRKYGFGRKICLRSAFIRRIKVFSLYGIGLQYFNSSKSNFQSLLWRTQRKCSGRTCTRNFRTRQSNYQ